MSWNDDGVEEVRLACWSGEMKGGEQVSGESILSWVLCTGQIGRVLTNKQGAQGMVSEDNRQKLLISYANLADFGNVIVLRFCMGSLN